LVKIAVELIAARTALNVVFLVVVAVVEVAEILLALLCPEGVFLFLLLAVDEVVHLRASSLPKLHIANGEIFRLDW
jgi:hypothetical protein